MTELERLQRIRDFWIGETARLLAAGCPPLASNTMFAWLRGGYEWQRESYLAGMRTVRATAAVRRHSGPAAARVGPRS